MKYEVRTLVKNIDNNFVENLNKSLKELLEGKFVRSIEAVNEEEVLVLKVDLDEGQV